MNPETLTIGFSFRIDLNRQLIIARGAERETDACPVRFPDQPIATAVLYQMYTMIRDWPAEGLNPDGTIGPVCLDMGLDCTVRPTARGWQFCDAKIVDPASFNDTGCEGPEPNPALIRTIMGMPDVDKAIEEAAQAAADDTLPPCGDDLPVFPVPAYQGPRYTPKPTG